MIDEKYAYSELTSRIIGCAMEVHNCLGSGFQEVIYQRSLSIEMSLQGIEYEREKVIQITYKNNHVGTRRADFFVEQTIMVEIKAVKALEDVHLAQAINYLEAYKMKIGLLINFGNSRLQFKRVMKPKPKKS